MFVDKLPTYPRASFLSPRVFGSLGLPLETCLFGDLPDSKRILVSCGSQAGLPACLPAITLVGEEGVELLLFVPGRGDVRALELMEVSVRPRMQLWEWWRETKSSGHILACHQVLCVSVTTASSLPTFLLLLLQSLGLDM